ncbi:hypothetical protein ABW19_dt0202432 [Dactylella cylindrospora]|nr:hypothetical protein ABW19_dt0202432 [Dactylella cylindrospora]
MSATLQQAEVSPPRVPKPRHVKENGAHYISYPIIESAFKLEHFNQMTGNWRNIKINPIMKLMKSCCESAIVELQSRLKYGPVRLEDQGDDFLQDLYELFLNYVKESPMSDDYRSLILDMLASTREEGQWLFFMCANQTLRNLPRRERERSTEAETVSRRPQHDPNPPKIGRVLTINECR